MTTTAILDKISRLPWQDKLWVAEKTLQALRHEQPASLEQAAEALAADYRTDAELTAFTSLDAVDFYEAR